MEPGTAQRIIESLRKGMPPDGHVRTFTVGRAAEVSALTSCLEHGGSGALLLKANYGSGKTHLLRFLRETALASNYLVSFVSLDAKAATRFNRMDQIAGAIWRGIELPCSDVPQGPGAFLQAIAAAVEAARTGENHGFWAKLTNRYRWDYSDVLQSPGLFVALRAWMTGNADAQRVVENWLCESWIHPKRDLYLSLVEGLRRHFRDPRSFAQLCSEDVFNFKSQGYHQSWVMISDICTLAREVGLAGFVVLFDEFEDVLTNLKRIDYKEAAFWNLFMFYSGKHFPGLSFFAVTPDFSAKCKRLQLLKERWDFDYSRFEELAVFEMSPLGSDELEELALRIMETHGTAYGWEPDTVMKQSELRAIVRTAARIAVEDRARHTIKTIVEALDRLVEE